MHDLAPFQQVAVGAGLHLSAVPYKPQKNHEAPAWPLAGPVALS